MKGIFFRIFGEWFPLIWMDIALTVVLVALVTLVITILFYIWKGGGF